MKKTNLEKGDTKMKRVIVIIVGTFLFVCLVQLATLARAAEYQLVYEKTMCQGDPNDFICQWDIIDSNMGVVTYDFVELPPDAIADANTGRVVFTPSQAGTFYIKLIASCRPYDPNGCLWPEQRWEEVIITVNPPVEWELQFAVVQE